MIPLQRHLAGLKTMQVYQLIIALCVPLVYISLFGAGYIGTWDDSEVLLNNTDVHNFNIKTFFTQHYVGNYAPITMLCFAIEWLLFKNASGYQHAVSLLFHTVNAILVFRLAMSLLEDKEKAFLVAVIFCFHPTQVETVAWLAAQNNLICGLFFFLALLSYVRYRKANKKKDYLFALCFFLLSVLSKPSAVCFPLCLFAMDYLLGKTFEWRSFLQKIPFFVIAFIIGVVTLYTRSADAFINSDHSFPLHVQIGYAGYALAFYLLKFLFPVHLSVIYPYPEPQTSIIVTGIIVVLIIAALIIRLFRRHKYAQLGALLFILANFLLVLQFVPYGETITADRYMYIPLLGFGLLLVQLFRFHAEQIRILTLTLLLVYGLMTGFRATVWKSSIALYTDIVDMYPESLLALNSLGAAYMLCGNSPEAYKCLDKAVNLAPGYYKAYYNRALLHLQNKFQDKALADFSKVIEHYPYAKAFIGRGNIYYQKNDLRRALADANAALSIEPQNIKALYLFACCEDERNHLDEAITRYTDCINIAPGTPIFYLRRGIVYGKKNDLRQCCADMDQSIFLNPGFAEAYYWRGIAHLRMNMDPCSDFMEARQRGFKIPEKIMGKYCRVK